MIVHQIKIKQHCGTQGCCDLEETVRSEGPIATEGTPTLDIPIGCLKAPLNIRVAEAVGYYFGLATPQQYVFDFGSRRYLRKATDEDISRWKTTRDAELKESNRAY